MRRKLILKKDRVRFNKEAMAVIEKVATYYEDRGWLSMTILGLWQLTPPEPPPSRAYLVTMFTRFLEFSKLPEGGGHAAVIKLIGANPHSGKCNIHELYVENALNLLNGLVSITAARKPTPEEFEAYDSVWRQHQAEFAKMLAEQMKNNG